MSVRFHQIGDRLAVFVGLERYQTLAQPLGEFRRFLGAVDQLDATGLGMSLACNASRPICHRRFPLPSPPPLPVYRKRSPEKLAGRNQQLFD